MRVVVSSPNNVLFEEDSKKVFLPLKGGDILVMENHAPLVGVLREGDVRCNLSAGGEKSIRISRGVVMVKDNKVEVLSRL